MRCFPLEFSAIESASFLNSNNLSRSALSCSSSSGVNFPTSSLSSLSSLNSSSKLEIESRSGAISEGSRFLLVCNLAVSSSLVARAPKVQMWKTLKVDVISTSSAFVARMAKRIGAHFADNQKPYRKAAVLLLTVRMAQ
jgi:hypothetical protein